MMRDAMIIFRKEIRGLLKDRRTLFSSLILPILIVPIIFLGMGSVLGGLQKDAEESVYSISIKGIEDPRFATTVTQFLQYSAAEDDSMADMMVIFPPGYRSGAKASVQLVYDSSSQKNQYAASQLTMAVNAFDQQLTADKLASVGLTTDDLNSLSIVMVDTAPQEARSGGSMLAMLMPYFLIIFLFAGSMSSGLDVTAGEKERGKPCSNFGQSSFENLDSDGENSTRDGCFHQFGTSDLPGIGYRLIFSERGGDVRRC